MVLNKYYIFLTCIKTYNHHKTEFGSIITFILPIRTKQHRKMEEFAKLTQLLFGKTVHIQTMQSNSYIHALIPMLACILFLKEWMNVLKKLIYILFIFVLYILMYTIFVYYLNSVLPYNFSFLSHAKISLFFSFLS